MKPVKAGEKQVGVENLCILCICVFVYLCICVFVYLCICICVFGCQTFGNIVFEVLV